MFTARTLREGSVPILTLAIMGGAAAVWSPWAALPPLILLAFTVIFFRDPSRHGPADPSSLLAPADGTVTAVEQKREEEYLHSESTCISIFLSIFDVHVQRSPVEGEIGLVRYRPGRHLDARRAQASLLNENRLVGIRTGAGEKIAIRQIGGKVARRIVGWKEDGARLARGERLGMIRFGSRVELFVPAGYEITVVPGQHVKGGETILARRTA
jgi:phosphatidylserine decarboxylase